MPINLRALSIALVLSGIISSPVFAATDTSTDVLLRGAKKWVDKDRADLAKGMLQKVLLIEPNSPEALYMLGNIELKNGKPEQAVQYLRTLEQTAPNHARTRELGAAYRQAANAKTANAPALPVAEPAKAAKTFIPTPPPKAELDEQHYLISSASKTGFSKTQDELSALYKSTGDTRYRLIQLELQSDKPEHLASAISGFEELSRNPAVNTQRLQKDWRRSLHKLPDHAGKQGAIKRFLTVYPDDREMIALLGNVQKTHTEQSVIAKHKTTQTKRSKPAPQLAGTTQLTEQQQREKEERQREAEKPQLPDGIAKQQSPAAEQPQQSSEAQPPSDAQPPQAANSPSATVAEEPPVDPDIVARTNAMYALDDGNLELAETTLTDVLKRRPQDPEVLGGLGLVKQRQGKPGEAEKWFEQAVQFSDESSLTRWKSLQATAGFWKNMRIADELLEDKRLPEAEAAVRQALVLQPDDPNALALLGNIKSANNELAEAERLYRDALKKEGYNVSAIRGLISLMSRTGRTDEALALVEQVHHDFPDELNQNPAIQAGLLREEADLYIAAHRTGHAIQALEMAVVLDPKDAWARFSLAKLYVSLDLAPLGKRVMAEGVALAPKDPDMLYARALVLLSLNDYAAGIDSMAQIPEDTLTQPMRETRNRALIQYYFQQADDKLTHGNRKEAIRIMSIAETQARGNFPATEQVAEGWFRLGLEKQGLSAMRKLPQPAPLRTQVYYASLLNRAKKDQELADLLPSIRLPDGMDETTQKYRTTIQDIEFAMAGRQFDKMLNAGKKEQAQQFAESVLNANQLSNADYFRYHRDYFSRADLPESAISQLVGEKEQYPNDLSIRWDLAYAYYQNKQNNEAKTELQELLGLTKGDDVDMRLRIAKLQQNIGDTSGAHQTMSDLVNRFPGNTDVLMQAGYMARASGKYNQAMGYFQQTKEQARIPAQQGAPAKLVEPTEAQNDVLLNLLPAGQADSRVREKTFSAPALVSTTESNSVYRSAIAGDTGKERAIASNPATAADQEIASIASMRTAKIETGLDIQSKSSNNGTSTYNVTEIPVLARFPIGYEAHGFVQLDAVNVDSGALPGTFANAALFGKIQAFQFVPAVFPLTPTASGTSVGVGYEQGSVKGDIGVVGIGFPVSNVVGGLHKGGNIGRMSYSIDFSRRPYTGSQLSYAGAKDPVTGVVWGGVTNTGVSLYLSTKLNSLGMNDFTVAGMASYGLLRGQNVLNNDRLYLRGSIDNDLYTSDDMVLNVGLNVNYMSFAQNETFYTFGHGGYYSPQSSLTFGLPVELSGRADLLSYQVRANFTYSRTREDAAIFYPTDPFLQAKAAAGPNFPTGYATATYPGGNGGGFGYGLRGMAEYRLTPNFAFGGRFNIDRSAYYAPNAFQMYMRYMFNAETGPVKMKPEPVVPYSQY